MQHSSFYVETVSPSGRVTLYFCYASQRFFWSSAYCFCDSCMIFMPSMAGDAGSRVCLSALALQTRLVTVYLRNCRRCWLLTLDFCRSMTRWSPVMSRERRKTAYQRSMSSRIPATTGIRSGIRWICRTSPISMRRSKLWWWCARIAIGEEASATIRWLLLLKKGPSSMILFCCCCGGPRHIELTTPWRARVH